MPDHSLLDLYGYRTATAEWAAISALFVSGYAAVTIAKVRSQILGRVRLPALAAHLEKGTSALASVITDTNNGGEEFELHLAKCEASLRTLKGSVKGNALSTTKSLLKKIDRYKNGQPFGGPPTKGRDEAWQIYTELLLLIEELKYVLEDQRVGG